MDVEEAVGLVRTLLAVDPATADRHQLAEGVAKSARLRALCDSRDIALGQRLAETSGYGEKAIADAARASMRAARKVLERGKTLEKVPAFASALSDGQVSACQVDAITSALRQVEAKQRATLASRIDSLVRVASVAAPEEFEQRLDREVRRLRTDDGMPRLEQQRRDTRLRSWVGKDGMWNAFFRCDPVKGVKIARRIDDEVAELFASKVPDTCPSDPVAKQQHLAGLAFISICERGGGRAGRPEAIVVLDHTALDERGRPAVDWGLPVDIPDNVLRQLLSRSRTTLVAVHPPADLDLGRRSRLASAAQRRVLRGLYPRCAIPDCPVRFDRTKIHHVWFWEDGGPTDLDNLLPVCSGHHTAVHDGGWRLKLLPDRTLTVTLPDGTTMTTGPPSRAP